MITASTSSRKTRSLASSSSSAATALTPNDLAKSQLIYFAHGTANVQALSFSASNNPRIPCIYRWHPLLASTSSYGKPMLCGSPFRLVGRRILSLILRPSVP